MLTLITKRTNKMILEAALSTTNLEEIRSLVVQTLVNIGDDDKPLYNHYTNRLSREATRLFYNMPATLLCLFNMDTSALRDLQCDPRAETPMTKKEFLVWQLTRRDCEKTTDDRVDYINARLSEYGFKPLDHENAVDRLVLNLLAEENVLCKGNASEPNARRTICRIIHAENEMAADRLDDHLN